MTKKLYEFLDTVKRSELKFMYSYDIDDDQFGIETDRYIWCKKVLEGTATIDDLLTYFIKHYAKHEKTFIETISNFIKEEI